jgi:hypothetical protein
MSEKIDVLKKLTKVPLVVVPLGTHEGRVYAKLETPGGERVQLKEQWVHHGYSGKVWGRYVSDSGEKWWFDRDEVDIATRSAKGKRKPFSVEITIDKPPPEGAVCALTSE